MKLNLLTQRNNDLLEDIHHSVKIWIDKAVDENFKLGFSTAFKMFMITENCKDLKSTDIEQLISWYGFSNKKHAHHSLLKWIQSGRALQIPELDDALKTFENWSIEISNYHHCRYTNAAVEGRNNKIKTIQRRCFFLRNRQFYKNRIFHECNKAFW